nr:protein SPA1-related 2-like isoform X1 [Tanacetum cinerariifolium]
IWDAGTGEVVSHHSEQEKKAWCVDFSRAGLMKLASREGMVDAKAVVIKLADRLHIKMTLDALSLSNLNSYTT